MHTVTIELRRQSDIVKPFLKTKRWQSMAGRIILCAYAWAIDAEVSNPLCAITLINWEALLYV